MDIECPNCEATVHVRAVLEPRHLNPVGEQVIHVKPCYEHTCPQPGGREHLPIAIGA